MFSALTAKVFRAIILISKSFNLKLGLINLNEILNYLYVTDNWVRAIWNALQWIVYIVTIVKIRFSRCVFNWKLYFIVEVFKILDYGKVLGIYKDSVFISLFADIDSNKIKMSSFSGLKDQQITVTDVLDHSLGLFYWKILNQDVILSKYIIQVLSH